MTNPAHPLDESSGPVHPLDEFDGPVHPQDEHHWLIADEMAAAFSVLREA